MCGNRDGKLFQESSMYSENEKKKKKKKNYGTAGHGVF